MTIISTDADATTPTILVVDDDEAVAIVIARGLAHAGFETTIANSGQEALEQLRNTHFDALLTDIHMPKLRGDDMQKIARQLDPDLAVLLITAAGDTASAVECLRDGVYDYLTKPFDLEDIVVRVQKALERRALALENADLRSRMEQRVQEQVNTLRRTIQGSFESLINSIEAKDWGTKDHSVRVSELAVGLARRLHPEDDVLAEQIRIAALFHDIGKIGISEDILRKEASLSDDEKTLVRMHPDIGASLLAPLLDPEIVTAVRSYHERFNGTGYPDAIEGEAIPLGSRIIAVADAFDAMISTRPYRSRRTRQEAVELLSLGSGEQWDPVVVEAFQQMILEMPA